MNADFLKNPKVGDRLVSIHGRQAYEVIHVSAHNVAYRWWSLDGKSSATAGCSRTQWEACPFALWPSDKRWPDTYIPDVKNPRACDRLIAVSGVAYLVTNVDAQRVEFRSWTGRRFIETSCDLASWKESTLQPWPSDKPWPEEVKPPGEDKAMQQVPDMKNPKVGERLISVETRQAYEITYVSTNGVEYRWWSSAGKYNGGGGCTREEWEVCILERWPADKPWPGDANSVLVPGQPLTAETAKLLAPGDVLIMTGTRLGEFTLKENSSGKWIARSEGGGSWIIATPSKYTFVRHGAAPLLSESKIGDKIANIRLQTEKRVNGSVHYKCPLSGSETVGWDEEGVVSYFNNTLCSGHTHFVPEMSAKPDEVKIIPDTLVPGQRISEKAWELLRPGDVIAYTGFKEKVEQTVEKISLTSGIVIFDDGRVFFQNHARQYEFVRHAEKSTPVHVPCCTCMSLTCVTCGPKMQKEEEAYCVQLTRDLVKKLSKEKPLSTMPIYSPSHIVGGLFGLYRNGRRR